VGGRTHDPALINKVRGSAHSIAVKRFQQRSAIR
jgi:hypothetical protein